MITNEQLQYLLSHCSFHGWCSAEVTDEIMAAYWERPIDVFELEAIIDNELQIMSVADALDIIRKEFPFDE